MKKLLMILLTGWAFALNSYAQNVAADDKGHGGIPLRNLAGTYSQTIHASFFYCLENNEPTPCTEGATGVTLDAFAVGTYTSDVKGHICLEWTETQNTLPLSVAAPAVFGVHQAATVTSYDPTTGAGDASYTNYLGGACHGSTFDSTGATAVAAGTYHFVASHNGKRLDGVVTAITNAVGSIGSFSITGTLLRE